MKVKHFADKYGLTQSLVFSASFQTPTRKRTRQIDIPEDELFTATVDELRRRIAKHREMVVKDERMLKNALSVHKCEESTNRGKSTRGSSRGRTSVSVGAQTTDAEGSGRVTRTPHNADV